MASGRGDRPLGTPDQEKTILGIPNFSVVSVTGGSSATSVNINTGSFTMGILVGHYRQQNQPNRAGLAVVYINSGAVVLGPKLGLETVSSVAYNNGVLTVTATMAYMTYSFIKLV